MQINYSPSFGLLPEPEGRLSSFLTSSAINGAILVTLLIVGMTARHVIEQHYETTELIIPTQPPPPVKVTPPPMPKMPPPPETPKLALEAPKIQVQPKPPEPKPVQMEAKVALPTVRAAKPQIILAPQPKAALTAAMPAQNSQVHPSTAPVHLGETFGVTPNPNASRPATGSGHRQSLWRHARPGGCAPRSSGIDRHRQRHSFRLISGMVGRVASAGIPGATGTSSTGTYGRVASAGIPAATAAPVQRQQEERVQSTSLEVLSKPPVQYTTEARALHVEGDVILRVTFLATGQVVVHGVVRGLGHGLDEEARRVAEQIRFRPATRDGHAVAQPMSPLRFNWRSIERTQRL